jgi:uncharacterized protein YajQ (UPF0234 family)
MVETSVASSGKVVAYANVDGVTTKIEVDEPEEIKIMREQKQQLDALAEWLREDPTRLQALKDLIK